MFYCRKKHAKVMRIDVREGVYPYDLRHNRNPCVVSPDVVGDFTAIPFPDETFYHVVFDPPHLLRCGERSWLAKKYGKLPKAWAPFLRAGFDECWRVLKVYGTLIFKWCAEDIRVSEITKAIGRKDLYGQRNGRKTNTHWLVFIKFPEEVH